MSRDLDNHKLGFCFDLDGTLINSTEIGDIIEKKIYEKYKIEIDKNTEREIEELTYKLMHGENRKNLPMKIMWAIFEKIGLNFFQRVNALLFASKIFKEELKNIKIYQGIEDVFDFFDANDILYSIATTSSRGEVDDRLSQFPSFYEKLKGKIITRSDVENMKPHPESLIKASKIMNLPPNKVIMVGDMHSDVIMGKRTNSVTIGVLTGIFNQKQFEEYAPDLILSSVANIPESLNTIKKLIREKKIQD
jgi:phosphoglycolate phosphatase-like HAD superfamily hydrolase